MNCSENAATNRNGITYAAVTQQGLSPVKWLSKMMATKAYSSRTVSERWRKRNPGSASANRFKLDWKDAFLMVGIF